MGHSHCHHDCGHNHAHAPANYDEAFAVGVVLNLAFVCIEAFYGFTAHSLALLADAGHNLGDVMSLLLAWGASWLSRLPPSRTRTYGFGRTTILASLVNAITLLVAVGTIGWAAALRLFDPVQVEAVTVMKIASVGVLINTGTALMFMRGRHKDINIRGAFLHMAFDAGLSLGVVAAAVAVTYTGWHWLDPAFSLVIAAVIISESLRLLRDSMNLTLDAVPAGVDRAAVETFLKELSGVASVHDLHIWPISTTSVALTAHLVKPAAQTDDIWLFSVCAGLKERFGIDHPTLQIERGDAPHACALAPDEVV